MKRLFTPGGIIGGIVSLLAFCSSSFAQTEEEKNFLLLYFKEEELVVQSATRSPKPLAQTAENITVVSAADIELMNAHSVAEVLNAVTGVEVWMTGGPGQIANAYIHGSETRHVTVIIDGVVLNNLGNNTVNLGMIPVQNIERIEIIKGPASSAWGSALGGVVNIITKSGGNGNGASGVLAASYGTKNSGDFRAEARGKKGKVGYYLTAGRLQSDGLTPRFDVSENSGYAKLTYDLTDDTGILFALGYEKTSLGRGLDTTWNQPNNNELKIVHTSLAVNSVLSKDVELNVSFRTIRQDFIDSYYDFFTGAPLQDNYYDKGYGSSAKLTRKSANQTIVLGTDYDDKTLNSNVIAGGELEIKKWALFANDTLIFDRLSITPGIRYDNTNINEDITSPSLGVTYSLANSTILRATAAKGFSIPTLLETFYNPDLKTETVWSYQAGAETAAVKYLWLKLSAFRNDLRDAILYINNIGRQRRQGVELAVKTAPVYNISFSAGAEYIAAKNIETGERLKNVPMRVYDLGIRYDDERSFRAMLQGRSIDWNADPGLLGDYSSFVFDLSLIKKVYGHKGSFLEAFANVHNIFNGSQYVVDTYKNPERWYEGGIRFKF